jgi:trans-aconitate methyltransferase
VTRTPPEYFARLYGADPDPWGFATSWYEHRKYAVTLACLPDERYRSGFEPGCSIGVLTEGLAARCDRLVAVDLDAGAVAVAAERLAGTPHVEVGRATVPDEWPEGRFDLLVLSELCYYFDAAELRALAGRASDALEPGAAIVAVHWTGPTDYPQTAGAAHHVLASTPGWHPLAHHDDERFVVDSWRYRPGG